MNSEGKICTCFLYHHLPQFCSKVTSKREKSLLSVDFATKKKKKKILEVPVCQVSFTSLWWRCDSLYDTGHYRDPPPSEIRYPGPQTSTWQEAILKHNVLLLRIPRSTSGVVTLTCSRLENIRAFRGTRLRHQMRMADEIFNYRKRFCRKDHEAEEGEELQERVHWPQVIRNIQKVTTTTRATIKVTVATTDVVLSGRNCSKAT